MAVHALQLLVTTLYKITLPTLLTVAIIFIIHRWQRLRVLQSLGYRVAPYSFLYGHAHRLLGRGGLQEAQRLFSEYGARLGQRGSTIAVYVGTRPHIWTTDPDLIRDVCLKQADMFPDRPAFSNPLSAELSHTLLTLKGARWKRVRAVLSPAFTASKLRAMAPLMADSARTFLQIVEEDRRAGRATDFLAGYQRMTLEVICRAALAIDVPCQREQHPLVETVTAVLAATPLANRLRQLEPVSSLLRPLLRATGATGKMVRDLHTMAGWLRGVVARREAAAVDGSSVPRDVLQLLLDARRADRPSDGSAPLSEDELISNAFIFVLAGYETTRTALAFTTHLLAAHPHVQDRLAAEVAQLPTSPPGADGGEELDCERVLSLPYLEMVVQESLRLFPPIPAMFAREVARETEVRGVRLPAGSVLSVAVFCLHRDPEMWPEPETFDPERFSSSGGRGHTDIHVPFGLGPRHCIGSRFALLQLKLVLCNLLRRYRVLPPAEPLQPVLAAPSLAPASGKIELRVELRE